MAQQFQWDLVNKPTHKQKVSVGGGRGGGGKGGVAIFWGHQEGGLNAKVLPRFDS